MYCNNIKKNWRYSLTNLLLTALSTFCRSFTMKKAFIRKKSPPRISTKHVVNRAYCSALNSMYSIDEVEAVRRAVNGSEALTAFLEAVVKSDPFIFIVNQSEICWIKLVDSSFKISISLRKIKFGYFRGIGDDHGDN